MTTSLREEILETIFEGNPFPTVEQIIDFTLSKVEKRIDDLEFEYNRRDLFDVDKKVVFEDITDIIRGKSYKEIFHDE